MPKWIDDVRSERGQDTVIVIVGNKTDCEAHRTVTSEEGDILAKNMGVLFLETSAKDGHNVTPLFRCIVGALPTPDAPAALTEIPIDLLYSTPPPTKTCCI